jgi:hypothetical protein
MDNEDAFSRMTLPQAQDWQPLRLLTFCLIPKHWRRIGYGT